MVSAVAFACGEKSTTNQKAKADAKVDSKLVKADGMACPASTAHTCDAACKTSHTSMASKAKADGKWAVRTVSVKGMTCGACENSVSAALAKVPGVVEVVKVCHRSEEAVLKVDPAAVKDAQLTKAITGKGFKAEIIPAVAKTSGADMGHKTCPAECSSVCGADGSKASAEKKEESK